MHLRERKKKRKALQEDRLELQKNFLPFYAEFCIHDEPNYHEWFVKEIPEKVPWIMLLVAAYPNTLVMTNTKKSGGVFYDQSGLVEFNREVKKKKYIN